MKATDFEYDGKRLSDFGFIICDFNHKKGAVTTEIGGKIKFNKIAYHNGKKHSLASTEYSDCIELTFDICKNPDRFDSDNREITDGEFYDIVRWLNQPYFLRMEFRNEEPFARHEYYNASFNLSKITISDKLYGISLKMETDSPFAYGEEKVVNTTMEELGGLASVYISQAFIVDSDCVVYPKLIITCREAGELSIGNVNHAVDPSDADAWCTIRNCSVGEVITIDCEHETISSSVKNHNLCDDFSFSFFPLITIDDLIHSKFGATEEEYSQSEYSQWAELYKGTNTSMLLSLVQCDIELHYTPLYKTIP